MEESGLGLRRIHYAQGLGFRGGGGANTGVTNKHKCVGM